MHVHEDILIGVNRGTIAWGKGNGNCSNVDNTNPVHNVFTYTRDEMVLQWIENIVPDVIVVGNMDFQLRNYLK